MLETEGATKINALPPVKQRLMLALSSRSPQSRSLLEKAHRLAKQLQADWFVVHVRESPSFHYRGLTTERPVPQDELHYAKRLGAQVLIERGDVVGALVSVARKMGIHYFVTGRSFQHWIVFRWKLPLTEAVQRKLPGAMVIIV